MASAVEPNQVSSAVNSQEAPTAPSQESALSSPKSPLLLTQCSECQSALLSTDKRYICILCDFSLNEHSKEHSYQICTKCFESGAQSLHPFFYEREHDPIAFERAGTLCSGLLNAGGVSPPPNGCFTCMLRYCDCQLSDQ